MAELAVIVMCRSERAPPLPRRSLASSAAKRGPTQNTDSLHGPDTASNWPNRFLSSSSLRRPSGRGQLIPAAAARFKESWSTLMGSMQGMRITIQLSSRWHCPKT